MIDTNDSLRKQQQEKKIHNAVIIVSIAASFIGIARILSLTGIIDDIGNGYFAGAYEIYSVLIVITYSCLSNTVEKMIKARIQRNQIRNARKVFQCSIVISLFLGGLTTLILSVFAKDIATNIIGLPNSSMALILIAPSIMLFSISGCFRGFLSGFDVVLPTHITTIFEQIIIWLFCFIGALYYTSYGEKVSNLVQNDQYRYIYGAAGSVLGISIGAAISLVIYIIIYMRYYNRFAKLLRKDGTIRDENYGQVYHIILSSSLPVVALILLISIHTILSQRYFNMYFSDHNNLLYSIKYFGIYYVKYRSVLLIPIILFIESSRYLPYKVKEYMHEYDISGCRVYLQTVIRNNLLYAIPITFFVAIMSKNIIYVLFGSGNEVSQYVLLPGTVLILLYSIIIPTLRAVYAMKKTKYLFLNLILANILYFILLILLLKYTSLGFEALMYSSILFAVVILSGNILILKKALNYKQEMLFSIFIPYNAAFISGFIIWGVNKIALPLIGCFFSLIITAILGYIVYYCLIAVLHGIQRDELESLPGGRVIIFILEKINLLQ